jgi:hypothetical protein
MSEGISKKDSIIIVRVVTKCSDLLTDFDTLGEYIENKKSKYVKHELKFLFLELGNYIDRFSSCFLKPFVEHDDISQMELQSMFTDLSKGVFIDNEEKTAFILFYAKVYSIMIDLSEMEYTDGMLNGLKELCDKFLDKAFKKHSALFNIIHKGENLTKAIIDALDQLGKKIMYSKEDESRID